MRCSKRLFTLLERSFHHPSLSAVGKTHSFCQSHQSPKEKCPKSMMPIVVSTSILIRCFRTFDNVELASLFQAVLKWALAQLWISASYPQEWFRHQPLTIWRDRETHQARVKVYSKAETTEEAWREGKARDDRETAQDCQENGRRSSQKHA